MAILKEIKSNVWGLSILGAGVIAEGLANLRQCIDIILRTTKGTDPLRPQFGTEIFKYIDAPVLVAIPNIKREILQALSVWEKRIRVQSVTHSVKGSQIFFEITYIIVDENLIDKLTLFLNGSDVNTDATNTELVLQAFFPPGMETKRVGVDFKLNSNNVLPINPVYGFSNINELFEWVKSVWGSYGKWVLNLDRLLLYLKPGKYTAASLGLYLLNSFKHIADISNLGSVVNQIVLNNGENVYSSPSDLVFTTPEQMLLWVRANWAEFGEWSLETFVSQPGDFNDDFNDDFSTSTGVSINIVLHSSIVTGLGQALPVIEIKEVV